MVKEIKIQLYDPKSKRDIVLGSTGEILDLSCINCITEESIVDGNYTLRAMFKNDAATKNIEKESIIKVKMDYGVEVFRVAKVKRNTRTVSVDARQITIAECINLWVNDTRPTNASGLSALQALYTGSIGEKEIFFNSDISKTSTTYIQRMNLYNAIHSSENCFMERWGGEIQRRQYTLSINSKIGIDRGVQIRSKKNLTGFEENTNIDNLITRISPVGFNGITANFVDSPYVNSYARVYTQEIKYDDIKVKSENDEEGFNTLEEAKAELIRRAKLEFSQAKVDELKADYRINFLDLSQTKEYKNYINLERVFLGDTVTVIVDNLDVNIKVRALKRIYDVLSQKVKEIELSNIAIVDKKAPSVNQILNQIQKDISSTNNSMSEYIQAMINSGAVNSYVLYRQNEILLMDNKDINAAINITRLNKNGLAFSQTGYYGRYSYGFTIDGKINASHILTGILTAILIQSMDGNLQIDLSDTGSGIQFKSNGNKAIDIVQQTIKWWDWDTNSIRTNSVGSIYSARYNGNNAKCGLSIAHRDNAYLALSYYDKDRKEYYAYVSFDRENVSSGFNGIRFWEPIKAFTIEAEYVKALGLEDKFNADNCIFASEGKMMVAKKSFQVLEDFKVWGTKNCIQKTENYGNRLYYSKESASSILTYDELEDKEVVANNELLVPINNIYKESVRLDLGYRVVIDKVKGNYDEIIKTKDYFIVKAQNGFKFTYSIEAKRQGFENEFLEEVNDSASYKDKLRPNEEVIHPTFG